MNVASVFHTNHGTQITALAITFVLELAGIRIKMDGQKHVFDNLPVEQLRRTAKITILFEGLRHHTGLRTGSGKIL